MNDTQYATVFNNDKVTVGDTVIKSIVSSGTLWQTIRTVEKIVDGKIYLDGNKGQAIRVPGQLIKYNK